MPLPIATAMMLMNAVPAAIKLGTGVAQGIKSRKYENVQRPTVPIPESYEDMLGMAKTIAGRTEMPGQDYMQQSIEASGARLADTAKDIAPSSGAALGALGDIQAQTAGQLRGLGTQAAQYRDKNEMMLMNALQFMGGVERENFMINEMQPFQDAMATAAALKEGSRQNIYGAASDVASAGTAAMALGDMGDIDLSFLGGGGAGAPEGMEGVLQGALESLGVGGGATSGDPSNIEPGALIDQFVKANPGEKIPDWLYKLSMISGIGRGALNTDYLEFTGPEGFYEPPALGTGAELPGSTYNPNK